MASLLFRKLPQTNKLPGGKELASYLHYAHNGYFTILLAICLLSSNCTVRKCYNSVAL